ncbi:hypothetical protein Ga0074812_109100 [Parafrankia irregularis]|uniref:Uncharacterized protein n=1 Tax=Parafrankia irregularis TaxID=795642 RepID=A0A0S4QMS1_9ACTN|nr:MULTISPECIES: hypothetical protein [Parafrankia]MBE3200548.1 hypothetical protein [Parafrankia sp. CH37]CUU56880.1 hypothetical protein Ga0074812_109100 [Parafrankia irregularis]
MSSGFPSAGLPPIARAIGREVTAACAAVVAQDPDTLHAVCGRLRALDEPQVRDVLHGLTLGLIEQAFPDGLDAADLRALLGDVLRPAAAWLPGLEVYPVAVVVTGVLSVHESGAPPIDAEVLLTACAVVVSHLLERLGAPLDAELARVFDELRQAQTMEMP